MTQNPTISDKEIVDFFAFPQKEIANKDTISRLRKLYASLPRKPNDMDTKLIFDEQVKTMVITDGPNTAVRDFQENVKDKILSAIADKFTVVFDDRLDPIFPILDQFIETCELLSKAFQEGRKALGHLNEAIQEDPRFSDELGNVLMKHVKFASEFVVDERTAEFFSYLQEIGIHLKRNKGHLPSQFVLEKRNVPKIAKVDPQKNAAKSSNKKRRHHPRRRSTLT